MFYKKINYGYRSRHKIRKKRFRKKTYYRGDMTGRLKTTVQHNWYASSVGSLFYKNTYYKNTINIDAFKIKND